MVVMQGVNIVLGVRREYGCDARGEHGSGARR